MYDCLRLQWAMRFRGTDGGTLSTLTSIASRQAERLGLHRDGTELGLNATETELRRRLWWQVTWLELTSGLLTGCIALNIYSEWTTKEPGNYEDDDFTPEQVDFPPKRQGLTGVSSACMTNRIFAMGRQKTESGTRLGMAWASAETLPTEQRKALIDKFEADLHRDFIRHCEPFDPYHTIISIDCRRAIASFRWFLNSPKRNEKDPSMLDFAQRELLFDLVLQMFEYVAFTMTAENLKDFVYHTRSTIMWPTGKHLHVC